MQVAKLKSKINGDRSYTYLQIMNVIFIPFKITNFAKILVTKLAKMDH
jgi:hypothetical protein